MEAGQVAQDPAAGQSGRWTPADPGPLGLGAFAMTTFVLSMYNGHLINTAGTPVVLGLALFYGGLTQLLAGMWEFRTGNTFGAVAFCSYGAFWLSFWAINVFYAKLLLPTHAGKDVGVYLYGWAIFTSYMWVASFRTSGAVNLVFVLLAITFFLLAIGNTGGHVNVIKIGGYFGLATAAAAWYASFAAVTNSTFKRTVIPVVPLTRA